jgi:hypothetical protein
MCYIQYLLCTSTSYLIQGYRSSQILLLIYCWLLAPAGLSPTNILLRVKLGESMLHLVRYGVGGGWGAESVE